MKVAVQHGIKRVVALLEVGCQVLFDAGMHSPSLILSLQSHTQQVTPMSVHKTRRTPSVIDTSACCALRQQKYSKLVQLNLCTTGYAQCWTLSRTI